MSTPFEHAGACVRASVTTTASPERAWEAWTRAEILSGWFTDRMKGIAVGGGTVTWIFDRFGSRFPYDVLIAEPPAWLVLKGSPIGRPPYFLEVRIAAEAGGGSRIAIANSGFSVAGEGSPAAAEEIDGVESGWRMALAILAHYLERYFGRPREPFFAMQPARFEYATIRSYFSDERLLARWLTRSGGLAGSEPGSPYRLELADGAPMSGRVLAVTPREIALSWDEIQGVVELKAFQLSPRQRAACVRGSSWKLGLEEAAGIERRFVTAIDRLVEALEGEEPGSR